jgi:hypothetical protein
MTGLVFFPPSSKGVGDKNGLNFHMTGLISIGIIENGLNSIWNMDGL